MNVLITGASGFVGRHLLAHLAQFPDYSLFGTTLNVAETTTVSIPMQWQTVDLRDAEAVYKLLSEVRPQLIFHLAAQAFVPLSYTDPWGTLENNLRGQVNLFQAMLKLDLDCRLLVVSSAHVYGRTLPHENPIHEDQSFRPDSPYSVSKVAQDMLGLQYFLANNLYTVRARPFNHIGPAQDTRFALPNFAAQIAAAEQGNQPAVIRVGNLAVERDFTDVRDVVRAYHLMLTQGLAGEAYNVCRGEAHSLQELVEFMCGLGQVPLKIEVDESRVRSHEVARIVGDASKLRQATAWEPTIDIQTSLTDILNFSRRQLAG